MEKILITNWHLIILTANRLNEDKLGVEKADDHSKPVIK